MPVKQTYKIQQLVDKICAGNFCCSDIGLLLVWLRPNIKNNPILLDLADFVAHNDEKDRGASYEHIHSIVESLIKALENGGEVKLSAVFRKKEVIENIIKTLVQLDLNIDEEGFRQQNDKIINCILELLEEIEIKFDDPKVIKCFLKRDNQILLFCVSLNLTEAITKLGSFQSVLFA